MKTALFVAGLLLAASSMPVLSQEVGRMQVGTHDAILYADHTWYFDCGGFPAMASKTVRMSFCIDPSYWDEGQPAGQQEFVYLAKDQKMGLFILPDQNYYAPADFHAAVLATAVQNGNTTPDKMQAKDAPSIEANGRTWMGTSYMLDVEGNSFSYLDYHLTDSKVGTAQVVFYTAPGDEAIAAEMAKSFIARVIFSD